MSKFPAPREGIVLTHFVVSADVARSVRFYTEVLGGDTVLESEPSIVALANGWIIRRPAYAKRRPADAAADVSAQQAGYRRKMSCSSLSKPSVQPLRWSSRRGSVLKGPWVKMTSVESPRSRNESSTRVSTSSGSGSSHMNV